MTAATTDVFDISPADIGGHWIRRKGIKHWVPDPPTPVQKPVYDSRKKRTTIEELRLQRPAKVVPACSKCGAMSNESCKTASGHTTTAHKERVVERRCTCGAALKPRRVMCDPCRDASYAQSQIEHMRRRSQERRALQQHCLECGAVPGRWCVSVNGVKRPPHRSRVVRYCECGAVLEFGRQKCDICRDRAAAARVARRRGPLSLSPGVAS